MQTHDGALRETDEGEPLRRKGMRGEDLVEKEVEAHGGFHHAVVHGAECLAHAQGVALDSFRIKSGKAVPLASARHAPLPRIRRVRRIENRIGQRLREKRRKRNEVIAVGAVAVGEHNSGCRRLAGRGRARRALKCIHVRH